MGIKAITKLLLLIVMCLLISCRSESTGPNDIVANVRPSIPKISIKSPTLNVIWKPGNTYTIKWQSSSEINRVNIELYKKTEYRRSIAKNIVNNNIYEWRIPNEILQSHHYKVRVVNSDSQDEYSVSEVFFILSY